MGWGSLEEVVTYDISNLRGHIESRWEIVLMNMRIDGGVGLGSFGEVSADPEFVGDPWLLCLRGYKERRTVEGATQDEFGFLPREWT